MKHYQFLYIGEKDNSYIFETRKKVFYEIRFKNSDYIFENLSDTNNGLFYEFVIDILENPHKPFIPADELIGPTIALIFNDFYANDHNLVTVYVCDSSDRKQDLRMKKFNQWFYKYQDTSFLKVDEIVTDNKNNRYPISLILKATNPNRHKIIDTFLSIKHLTK